MLSPANSQLDPAFEGLSQHYISGNITQAVPMAFRMDFVFIVIEMLHETMSAASLSICKAGPMLNECVSFVRRLLKSCVPFTGICILLMVLL